MAYKTFLFIVVLQKALQNLEDAGDELMLADDDQPIPYPASTHYFNTLNFIMCTRFVSAL